MGGIARFQTLCNYYAQDGRYANQPALLTLFSGDAFNPSLESSVTKGMQLPALFRQRYDWCQDITDLTHAGSHMVPLLNATRIDASCLGNHDLDFGMEQFEHLSKRCTFPWLVANVFDPALGEGVPLGNCKRTVMLTASNGIKIGVVGLVEREWLATLNSLPPNLKYVSASATAAELAPQLRDQGAEIVIAISHQRQPNDEKLAHNVPEGTLDLILGGHDHTYTHCIINGIHLLRSGTDFKQLSYLEGRKKLGGKGWDFDITRRDVVSSIAEDQPTLEAVIKITSALKAKMEKPIGWIAAPLDARFTTVRLKESNMGNFVCDLMKLHYDAECCIMAAGTVRGDQVYPPGVLKVKVRSTAADCLSLSWPTATTSRPDRPLTSQYRTS